MRSRNFLPAAGWRDTRVFSSAIPSAQKRVIVHGASAKRESRGFHALPGSRYSSPGSAAVDRERRIHALENLHRGAFRLVSRAAEPGGRQAPRGTDFGNVAARGLTGWAFPRHVQWRALFLA